MSVQAIISDVHANEIALRSVLEDCSAQKVDEIVCLGDIVGYGSEPAECIDLIREKCKWTLCGNHDVAIFLPVPVGFNKIAREALEWHRRVLEPGFTFFGRRRKQQRWAWLRRLDPSFTDGDVLYVHGSPRDPLMEYIEEGDVADMGFGPPQKIVDIFERIPWLCFCGHSHRPGVVTDDYLWFKPEQLPHSKFGAPRDRKTLVNVGSVGQPRDQNPDASYVLFDRENDEVTFRRVPYDVEAAQERMKRHSQLHPRTWQRLQSGV